MAIVNYVVEHIRFMEYASEEKLKGSVMLLWYALMHQMNQRAQGNMWPEEFVRIDNDRLLSYLPMEYDTFAAARNKLKQIGRIDFIPGERNKTNPAYKMIYFYPNYVRNRTEEDGNGINPSPLVTPMDGDPKEQYEACCPNIPANIGYKTGFCPENSDNIPCKQGGKPGGNMGGNNRGKQGDIYYKLKQENKPEPDSPLREDEEDDDAGATSPAHAGTREADDPIPNRKERMKALKDAYTRAFGRRGSIREIERILDWCNITGMPDETAMRAVELAAGGGAEHPIAYALTILDDWKHEHVYQPHQIDEYLNERERWKNRGMAYGSGDILEEYAEREKARERRKQENIASGLERG